MPETTREAPAHLLTVQMTAETWGRLAVHNGLQPCEGCLGFYVMSDLDNGQCVDCRPKLDPIREKLKFLLHCRLTITLPMAESIAKEIIATFPGLTPEPAPEAMTEEWLKTQVGAFRASQAGSGRRWTDGELARYIITQQANRDAAQAEMAKLDDDDATRKFGKPKANVVHDHATGRGDPICTDCNQPYGAHEGLTCPQAAMEPHVHDWDKPGVTIPPGSGWVLCSGCSVGQCF